jgi:hypothetical protein
MPGKGMASYEEASALGRCILNELMVPVRGTDGLWAENDDGAKLIHPPGQLFWTEHSERHTLVSIAIGLHFQKVDVDFVGRWAVGMSQSLDYVLTARQIILRIQETVVEELCNGFSDYDEIDALDSYREFLISRGVSVSVARLKAMTLDIMVKKNGKRTLGASGWSPDMLDTETPEAPPVIFTAPETVRGERKAPDFWCSVSKRGWRRLHRDKGCWVVTDKHCMAWEEVRDPATVAINDRCKLCWPTTAKKIKEAGTGLPDSGGESVNSEDEEDSSESDPEMERLPDGDSVEAQTLQQTAVEEAE